MRQYKRYTDDVVCQAAAKVYSLSGLISELGLVKAGGNYNTVKMLIQKLNIDTTHWTGQGWSKDQQLKDWSQYNRAANLKPHLIKARGHFCEKCKLSKWLGEIIKLEIHHVDEDRTNNNLNNLLLLCPNCHSCTPGWRKSKCGQAPIVKGSCVDCGDLIHKDSDRCRVCNGIRRQKNQKTIRSSKIEWPDYDTLKNMVQEKSYLAVGRDLGVSDNAVRKRLMAKKHQE